MEEKHRSWFITNIFIRYYASSQFFIIFKFQMLHYCYYYCCYYYCYYDWHYCYYCCSYYYYYDCYYCLLLLLLLLLKVHLKWNFTLNHGRFTEIIFRDHLLSINLSASYRVWTFFVIDEYVTLHCLFESHGDPQVSYQYRALLNLFKIWW